MKIKNSLNIMKKISKRHLKLCEKNIILPEARSAINSKIYITSFSLVYRGSAQEKILPLISPITGNLVTALIYRGFRRLYTGNLPVTAVTIIQLPKTTAAQCVNGKKTVATIKSPLQRHKNTHVVTLQSRVYTPP
jgi:hypothetical protein